MSLTKKCKGHIRQELELKFSFNDHGRLLLGLFCTEPGIRALECLHPSHVLNALNL